MKNQNIVKKKPFIHGLTCTLGGLLLTFSGNLFAENLTQVDRLTKQWLDTERQASHLAIDWQAQKPLLSQRLVLLNAEKQQLHNILKKSQDSQEDVTIRRTDLLQQQSNLEQQQLALTNKLALLIDHIEHLSALLPPPLMNAWTQEQSNLSEEPETSEALQLALAKLSSLMEFQKRISLHEGPITVPSSTGEVMVKQLYLGVGTAWFVSADGHLKGRGQVQDNKWVWIEDDSIDGAEIRNAIDIFEKRKQADFVKLPVNLTALSKTNINLVQTAGGQ